MNNWSNLIESEFLSRGEDFTKMITTLTEEDLHTKFDDGYGRICGKPFTTWGEKYAYFPVSQDGAEWVESAPRYVCEEPTKHIGII